MTHAERQRHLERLLVAGYSLWHPQPFCQIRPAWCQRWPALHAALLAMDDDQVSHFNDHGEAARSWLAGYVRDFCELTEMSRLIDLPPAVPGSLAEGGKHWAWEIPGRKEAQVRAFAAAARASSKPLVDWCGGKGHLGRCLGIAWKVPVLSLDIDPELCAEGRGLAQRAGVAQDFQIADALASGGILHADQHLVALHACGELHRTAIREGSRQRVAALDIAPCCYHRGVAESYQALSSASKLELRRDDLRLAVTETVTASPRLARQRDRGMAWKLGFDALRRQLQGDEYRSFKPVSAEWLRAEFPVFCQLMAEREQLSLPSGLVLADFERQGWQRQREVVRLSIVRHAFRRPLEIWLVTDMALYLEERGYAVDLAVFCERRLTPRNLMLSARWTG